MWEVSDTQDWSDTDHHQEEAPLITQLTFSIKLFSVKIMNATWKKIPHFQWFILMTPLKEQ